MVWAVSPFPHDKLTQLCPQLVDGDTLGGYKQVSSRSRAVCAEPAHGSFFLQSPGWIESCCTQYIACIMNSDICVKKGLSIGEL